MKRRALAWLLPSAVVAALFVMLSRQSAAPPEPAAQILPDAGGAEVYCIVRDRLKRGESLYDLLLRHGVSPRQSLEAGAALRPVLPPRALRAQDAFLLHFDTGLTLQSLSITRSPFERYELAARDDGFGVRTIRVPVDTLYRTVWGKIDDNLWNAFTRSGAPPSVIVSFTEVFAWSVDFFRDARPGDAFGVRFPELRVEGKSVGTGEVRAAYYVRGLDTLWAIGFAEGESLKYFDLHGQSLRKALLRAPLRYSRVSSGFSARRLHPVSQRYKPHRGIDYAAPSGTPVYSAGDGRVQFAGWKNGLGKCVEVRHPNGFRTVYGHLRSIARGIGAGTAVEQKQLLGYVGATGNATGPHLHYEVWQGNKAVNPSSLKLPARGPVAAERMEAFRSHCASELRRLVPPYGPFLADAG